MASPTATLLTSGTSQTNATSYATASVALGATSKLYLMFVALSRADGVNPGAATCTGWTAITNLLWDGAATWRARSTCLARYGNSTTAALSIAGTGGETLDAIVYEIVDVTGALAGNLASAVRQSVGTITAATTTTGTTLGSLQSDSTILAHAAGFGTPGTTATPKAGYTELHDAVIETAPASGTFLQGTCIKKESVGDTTPSVTWAALRDDTGMIAVEIASSVVTAQTLHVFRVQSSAGLPLAEMTPHVVKVGGTLS